MSKFVRYFTVKDATYKFIATESGEIFFHYHGGTTADGQKVVKLDMFGYDEHLDTELTGMGHNAIAVFRKVLDIIKEWVSVEKPSLISFNASEPKRQRTYAKLVKVLETQLPGYEIALSHNGYYILRKQ